MPISSVRDTSRVRGDDLPVAAGNDDHGVVDGAYLSLTIPDLERSLEAPGVVLRVVTG
jgi:hypothetical protein